MERNGAEQSPAVSPSENPCDEYHFVRDSVRAPFQTRLDKMGVEIGQMRR